MKSVHALLFFALVACSLSFAPLCRAHDHLFFGANVRIQYKFQDNFNQKHYGGNPKRGSADDGFLLGRLRLGFGYHLLENLHISMKAQDSEVWDRALSDNADNAFCNKTFDTEHNPSKEFNHVQIHLVCFEEKVHQRHHGKARVDT